MLDLIIMYVLMAGLFTFGKQALLNSSPFFLTGVRLMPSGIIFLTWAWLTNKKSLQFSARVYGSLFWISVLYFSMDAFRLISLTAIPASHAALIGSLAPFIAALIAFYWFDEKFTKKKAGALLLGFVGILPLIVQNIVQTKICETAPQRLVGGYACMLISVVSAVTATFIFKKLLQDTKSTVFGILGIAVFFGGLLSLGISLFFEPWLPIPVENMQTVLPLIIFLFITHNLIAQPLYGYLVKKYPVTLITFATLITPLTSALFGYFLYGQTIGYIFIFSLISLTLAFRLFYHEERTEGLVK